MTKTVKKRLQAVVALLVTLMIMVGIMPNEPFNTTVYAGDVICYFDTYCVHSYFLSNLESGDWVFDSIFISSTCSLIHGFFFIQ